MTEKLETKKSQPTGERGRFYFTPILITLKKFLWLPEFLRQFKAQSAIEYFVILCAVLAISLLSVATFYPRAQEVANKYFSKVVAGILNQGEGTCNGEVVYDGGVAFCRVNGSSCGGSTQYKEWSTTSPTPCDGVACHGEIIPGTTGSHTWQDLPPEWASVTRCIPVGSKDPCNCPGPGRCYATTIQIGCVVPDLTRDRVNVTIESYGYDVPLIPPPKCGLTVRQSSDITNMPRDAIDSANPCDPSDLPNLACLNYYHTNYSPPNGALGGYSLRKFNAIWGTAIPKPCVLGSGFTCIHAIWFKPEGGTRQSFIAGITNDDGNCN